jgi:hypothetical protein
VLPTQVLAGANETERDLRAPWRDDPGGPVTRALKSNFLWLTLAYVGLLLLMARAYS